MNNWREVLSWRPSKSQRKDFAIRMQDPEEREAYEKRKREKAQKRRENSSFNYNSAGGFYKPTENQNNLANAMLDKDDLTFEEKDAVNQLISAYSLNDKVHHDIIHIVNEYGRNNGWNGFIFNK